MNRADAASLASWAVDALTTAVGLTPDPVKTARVCRELLAGRADVSAPLLAQTLIAAAASVQLELREVPVDEGTLSTRPLPVLTFASGGAAVTERRGPQLLVTRPGLEPSWMTAEELLASLGDAPLWFSAAPAAPLQDLARHGEAHPSPVSRLWALMHLERDDLQVIVIYAVAAGLLTLATPVAVQTLVGTVAFGTVLQPIVVLALMLMAALSFQAILRALQARVVESVQERAFVRTAADLAWRLPRVQRHDAPGFGPTSVNEFFEVITLQKTAGTLLTDGIAAALQIGIGLMVLAFYHPALLAFALVLIAFVALVWFVPFRRGLRTSIDESYAKYRVAAWLEQLARPGNALRAFSGDSFAADRADGLIKRYLEARRKHFAVVFGQTIGALALQVVASAALLGLGGWLVLSQALTLGQLVAAELIVAAISSSIAKLGKLLDATYDLLTAVDKLGHLVDLPIENPEPGEPVPGQGGVRVEVHSAPLSLEVAAGARVAVVGAEGHSLGHWLAGLQVPEGGVISFNGVETSRTRTHAVREHIAFIQPGDFFEGTVLENLTLGRPGVTTSDARAALERVGLLDELRELPQGLDTRLAHDGAPLTHAHITCLLVARALASAPRLIVVDAPLDSLPPEARSRCVAALTRAAAPWTLVALVSDPQSELARSCARVVSLSELSGASPRKATS
ncbi:MAG: ATP-binding cassette domain-containing protein [Archangium sp.]|nr:ATP-binding cassette domain-containing protein [Archangium sp.]MDP3151944.1 ATP-binding cassette domain-containing protein [Archangium sp.]MDP3571357.1 ATP-binding cassette domain-containing protein [Archangium sp.]